MKLLISRKCGCIRSPINGRLLAQCARCRAARDPDFAERCIEAPPRKKTKRGHSPHKLKGNHR